MIFSCNDWSMATSNTNHQQKKVQLHALDLNIEINSFESNKILSPLKLLEFHAKCTITCLIRCNLI